MPNFSKTALLPYTAEQLFALVLDIEAYPQFLPWCLGAQIVHHARDGSGGHIIAALEIGYKALRASYVSDITYEHASQVHVRQKEGPLSHLHNQWRFIPTGRGCRLHFEVDFGFKSNLLNYAIQPVFIHATETMVEAFTERARQVILPPL
jgi:coenzyme Q-binding protein COQ10